MKTKYLLFLSVILFIKCTSPNVEVKGIKIPLQYDLNNVLPFSESDYGYTIDVIPLDNTPEAYIKSDYNRIEISNNIIYIMSLGGSINIFNRNGTFLSKINKGRGPGEILLPSDISYDKVTEKLEVLDVDGVKIYDSIGNYQETIPNKNKYVEFVKYGDKRIFFDSNKDPLQKSNFIIIRIDGKTNFFEDKYGPTLIPTYAPRHFSMYNDELYLCSNYSNTIYKMRHKDSIPIKFAYVEEMNSDNTIKDISNEEYRELCKREKWFSKIFGFSQIDKNLFEISISKDFVNTFLFDNEKNELYNHPFQNIPFLFKPLLVDNSSEYFLFSPDLLDKKIRGKGVDNNPKLYSKLKAYIKNDDTQIQNMLIVHLTYFRK